MTLNQQSFLNFKIKLKNLRMISIGSKKFKRSLVIGGLVATIALIIGLSLGLALTQRSLNDNLKKAEQILTKFPLIDGHNDVPSMVRKNFKNQFKLFDFNDLTKLKDELLGTNGVTHTDIMRLKKGRLGAQFWAAYASCESLAKDAARIHLEQLDMMKRLINKFPSVMKYVDNSKDLVKAFNEGKIASLLGLESGHAIDSSLAILRIFYALGVRYMTLTHNCNVPWATNNLVDRLSNASAYGGLTDFGRKVIREMNRLGMMVDLSHVSHQTMLDALEESKAPVIFSHSSVYSLCNHTRNVRDDVLLKLKQNNGIIMINLYNGFITPNGQVPSMSDIIAHFDYVKKLTGGVDHIGIGADFDGVGSTPPDVKDVSMYPALFAALLENKWTEEELAKIAGQNIIRVLSANEKVAKSLEHIEPIDDIIDQKDLGDLYSECRTSF